MSCSENCICRVPFISDHSATNRRFWLQLFVCGFAIAWLLGPSAGTTRAQLQDPLQVVGIPAFSAQLPVEQGSINATNGNLHLEIPLGSFPQRGRPPFKIALVYDSTIWSVQQLSYWYPSITYHFASPLLNLNGWRIVTSGDPGLPWQSTHSNYVCSLDNKRRDLNWDTWTWTSSDGTEHGFPIFTVMGFTTKCGPPPVSNIPSADALAFDNSGYHMYVTNFSSAIVYAPDGTIASGGNQITAGAIDTNGNHFSYSNQNQTDTLGRTPVVTSWNGTTITLQVSNSQGGTSTFTATVAAIPVKTNFSSTGGFCSEYGASLNEIQSITLPDLTSYQFGYDSGTTAGHYGQLTSMILPTGSQVTYSYANFKDSELSSGCSPHITREISTRTTPDGTWNYAPAVITQCTTTIIICQQQLTVTKPAYIARNDNAIFKSNITGGAWPYEADYYTGAVSSANLIATLTPTFDLSHLCPSAGGLESYACQGAVYVNKTAETTTLPVSGGSLSTTTKFVWDGGTQIHYGNLTQKSEWNFGSSTSNPADRTTTTVYLNGSSYINGTTNILNRSTSVTVTNSSGGTVAQTVNSYDDWTLATSGATGLVNHDDVNYGVGKTARGNLTQSKKWLNTTGGFLTTSNHYDIAGNLVQTTDPNGNNTYFDYTDNFYGVSPSPPTAAYVTKITKPVTNGINHISRVQYYYGSGLTAAKCGENFASTCAYGLSALQPDYMSYSYDSMERPVIINAGDGGQTSWSYSTSPSSAASTSKIDASHNLVRKTIFDGLGRTSQMQSSGGQGTIYTDTTYDSVGRVHSVSNPHFSTSSPTDGVTTYSSYDGLDRVTLVTKQDNSTVSTAYAGNCKTVTDEALTARKSCYDAFGRLTGIWEDPGSSPHFNYETDYQYDLLDNLTSVTQSASRQRTFTYDSLSRLVCAANPEIQIANCPATSTGSYTTGTIGYVYDSNSNMTSKTAPKPNQTSASVTVISSYLYDPLNRLIQKSYNDGTTPTVQYGFDGIAPANCSPSLTMNYPIGRRTAMCDAAGSEGWSYDVMGRSATDQRTTNGSTKTTTYSTPTVPYNFDGSIAQLTYPSGRTITYTPNIAAQPVSAIDTANSINYATMALYGPQGALTSMMNGTNILATMFYNKRLQPCRFAVNATGTAPGTCPDTTNRGDVMDYSYDFHLGVSDNGNVYKVSNNRTNASDRNINYGYDSLNRIATAYTDGNLWGETYTIDAWANLTGIGPYSGKPSGETLSEGVNGSNQLTNACSANCYDSAGNLLNDGLNSYTYDPEGHTVTGAGVTYYYDGDGKRVRKSSGTLYWYGMNSDSLDETDASGNVTEYVFFDGKRIARRDPSGNIFYYFADHLGTSRAIIQQGQNTSCYDQDFYPYGREVPHSSEVPAFVNICPQNYKFTGKERDSESGLDNFGARYDSSQYGRFMTPDSPSYANRKNPQSWNLYAYSLNNPVSFRDADGHDIVCDNNAEQCKKDAAKSTASVDAANRVTTETKTHGWWIFKWTETKIAIAGDINSFRGLSTNAAKLADLVTNHNITVTVTYQSFVPGTASTYGFPLNGGSDSRIEGRGLAQAFIDPNRTPDAVYDRDAVEQRLPQSNTGEEFGHEVLGHIWGDLMGGAPLATRGNMRDSIAGENAVRALDPTRGQKGIESHHNYQEMPELKGPDN